MSGGKVVDIAAARPHLTGEAVCSGCKHEWVAVLPVGFEWIECPSCGGSKGLLKHPCIPDEYWRCKCGSDLFYLMPAGARCRECALMATDWSG